MNRLSPASGASGRGRPAREGRQPTRVEGHAVVGERHLDAEAVLAERDVVAGHPAPPLALAGRQLHLHPRADLLHDQADDLAAHLVGRRQGDHLVGLRLGGGPHDQRRVDGLGDDEGLALASASLASSSRPPRPRRPPPSPASSRPRRRPRCLCRRSRAVPSGRDRSASSEPEHPVPSASATTAAATPSRVRVMGADANRGVRVSTVVAGRGDPVLGVEVLELPPGGLGEEGQDQHRHHQRRHRQQAQGPPNEPRRSSRRPTATSPITLPPMAAVLTSRWPAPAATWGTARARRP